MAKRIAIYLDPCTQGGWLHLDFLYKKSEDMNSFFSGGQIMFARNLMAGVFCGSILAFVVVMFVSDHFSKKSTERTSRPEIQITVDHSLPILLPECARNLSRALATHLDNQVMGSGDIPVQGRIVAMNDVLCEEPERMANLAIIATIESGAKYYARSHLHFLDNGDLANTYSEQWKHIDNSREWKAEWCEFIQLVYPKELTTQQCAPASE